MKKFLISVIAVTILSLTAFAQDNQYGVGAVYNSASAQESRQSAGGFAYVIYNRDINKQKVTFENTFFVFNNGVVPNPEGRVVQNDFKFRTDLNGLSWDFGLDKNTAQVYATGLASVSNQQGRTQFNAGLGVGFRFNDNSFVEYHYIPPVGATQYQGHRFTAEHYHYLNSSQNYYTRVGVTGNIAKFNPVPTQQQDIANAIFFVGFGKRY
ncbi:MAG TPA: hypothetical protein PLP33_14730 [Leptospiraceae bacterium]|nr:hypothetical protein [Leptospiraceae bacterium]